MHASTRFPRACAALLALALGGCQSCEEKDAGDGGAAGGGATAAAAPDAGPPPLPTDRLSLVRGVGFGQLSATSMQPKLGADKARDGDPATAWRPKKGAKGGVGEALVVTFPGRALVKEVTVTGGVLTDESGADAWEALNRIAKATLVFSDGTKEAVVFKGTRGPETFPLKPREVTSVKLVVDEVTKGTKGNELGVAELDVIGEALVLDASKYRARGCDPDQLGWALGSRELMQTFYVRETAGDEALSVCADDGAVLYDDPRQWTGKVLLARTSLPVGLPVAAVATLASDLGGLPDLRLVRGLGQQGWARADKLCTTSPWLSVPDAGAAAAAGADAGSGEAPGAGEKAAAPAGEGGAAGSGASAGGDPSADGGPGEARAPAGGPPSPAAGATGSGAASPAGVTGSGAESPASAAGSGAPSAAGAAGSTPPPAAGAAAAPSPGAATAGTPKAAGPALTDEAMRGLWLLTVPDGEPLPFGLSCEGPPKAVQVLLLEGDKLRAACPSGDVMDGEPRGEWITLDGTVSLKGKDFPNDFYAPYGVTKSRFQLGPYTFAALDRWFWSSRQGFVTEEWGAKLRALPSGTAEELGTARFQFKVSVYGECGETFTLNNRPGSWMRVDAVGLDPGSPRTRGFMFSGFVADSVPDGTGVVHFEDLEGFWAFDDGTGWDIFAGGTLEEEGPMGERSVPWSYSKGTFTIHWPGNKAVYQIVELHGDVMRWTSRGSPYEKPSEPVTMRKRSRH